MLVWSLNGFRNAQASRNGQSLRGIGLIPIVRNSLRIADSVARVHDEAGRDRKGLFERHSLVSLKRLGLRRQS